MRQAGREIGHDQVVRSMGRAGLRGAIRDRKPITTTPATRAAGRSTDLVRMRLRRVSHQSFQPQICR